MGTSVGMIKKHYGQTRVLVGIEHETARRRKLKPADKKVTAKTTKAAKPEMPNVSGALLTQGAATSTSISTSDISTLLVLAAMQIYLSNLVPVGSVDATPEEEGQPDVELEDADLIDGDAESLEEPEDRYSEEE